MELNQETLLAYKKRWQIVAQKEEAERKNTTVAERWRKVNALLRMAAALDLQTHHNESPYEITYQNWNRLRDLYLDNKSGEVS